MEAEYNTEALREGIKYFSEIFKNQFSNEVPITVEEIVKEFHPFNANKPEGSYLCAQDDLSAFDLIEVVMKDLYQGTFGKCQRMLASQVTYSGHAFKQIFFRIIQKVKVDNRGFNYEIIGFPRWKQFIDYPHLKYVFTAPEIEHTKHILTSSLSKQLFDKREALLDDAALLDRFIRVSQPKPVYASLDDGWGGDL